MRATRSSQGSQYSSGVGIRRLLSEPVAGLLSVIPRLWGLPLRGRRPPHEGQPRCGLVELQQFNM